MESRFSELYRLPINLHVSGSPLIIEKSALLRDNITGERIFQFRCQSFSIYTITRIVISVRAFSYDETELQGLQNYAIDVEISPSDAFENERPIYMPDNTTSKCSVDIKEVTFRSGDVWKTDEEWTSISQESRRIETEIPDETLRHQYKLSACKQAKFIPFKYQDLWICSCGTINKSDTKNFCRNCLSKKDSVFAMLDEGLLKEELEKSKEQRKTQIEEQDNHYKKVKHKIITAVVAVAFVISCLFAWSSYLNSIYEKAVEQIDKGCYNNALEICNEILNYKDISQVSSAIKYYNDNESYDAIKCVESTYQYKASAAIIRKIIFIDDPTVVIKYVQDVPLVGFEEIDCEYQITYEQNGRKQVACIAHYKKKNK